MRCVLIVASDCRAAVMFLYHTVTLVIRQLDMTGGRCHVGQPTCRIIAVIQRIVRRGFFDKQAAGWRSQGL
ncbi:hypothetical protein [Pectobacterium parmentieri]|uniref:hypothetical protein n=1 Tax=Pectobacterium parmentieri TaxID=1905730 RepID=UPI0039F6C84B